MIGSEDFRMDLCVLQPVRKASGADKIIDPPSRVFFPCLKPVGPPGIFGFARMGIAPAVAEAGGEQFAHFAPLLVGEAGVEMVRGGILQVNLLVGDVHVAADHHALLRGQAAHIGAERVLPLHPVIQAAQAVLRVGDVHVDQVEDRQLQRDDTPLVVVLVHPYAISHRRRYLPCEDGGAGVAFLVGIVPIALVALEGYVELSGLDLRLLKTEEVGIQLLEYLAEALALTGTQAIYVPTNESNHLPFGFS